MNVVPGKEVTVLDHETKSNPSQWAESQMQSLLRQDWFLSLVGYLFWLRPQATLLDPSFRSPW